MTSHRATRMRAPEKREVAGSTPAPTTTKALGRRFRVACFSLPVRFRATSVPLRIDFDAEARACRRRRVMEESSIERSDGMEPRGGADK
jgi:hypothetical protein